MTVSIHIRELRKKWNILQTVLKEDLLWTIKELRSAANRQSGLEPDEKVGRKRVRFARRCEQLAKKLVVRAQRAWVEVKELAKTDLGPARTAEDLAHSQHQFDDLERQLFSKEFRQSLDRFGRKNREGWDQWARQLAETIERCRLPMYDLSLALGQCWRAHSARLETTTVSVRATGIGRQVRYRNRRK